MSNSGRKINYGVRPAKSIERKMMRDMMNRLSSFGPLKDYRYIGFGSKYFVDYVLFHKFLDIREMISIEGDLSNPIRYEFNKPFNSIQIISGKSTQVLPRLRDSEKRTVYWLDYDGGFDRYMLEDVAIVSRDIVSGSMLSLSFNCDGLKFNVLEPDLETIQDQLVVMVGSEHVGQINEARGWGRQTKVAEFLSVAVSEKISSVLTARNNGKPPEDFIIFEQVGFFNYADGAKMTTLSYVFFKESEREKFDGCRMNELYFYRTGNVNAYSIKVPNLTLKEIRHVMEVMPDTDLINKDVLVLTDAEALWENYRYFPSFTELEPY